MGKVIFLVWIPDYDWSPPLAAYESLDALLRDYPKALSYDEYCDTFNNATHFYEQVEVKDNEQKCKNCQKTYPATYSFCPECGYESGKL